AVAKRSWASRRFWRNSSVGCSKPAAGMPAGMPGWPAGCPGGVETPPGQFLPPNGLAGLLGALPSLASLSQSFPAASPLRGVAGRFKIFCGRGFGLALFARHGQPFSPVVLARLHYGPDQVPFEHRARGFLQRVLDAVVVARGDRLGQSPPRSPCVAGGVFVRL